MNIEPYPCMPLAKEAFLSCANEGVKHYFYDKNQELAGQIKYTSQD
jgi:hypothetical protein